MILLKIILYPFSLLYGIIVAIRNALFNQGIFKTTRVNAFVISVGNLAVGGTGKTPHVEYLVRLLKNQKLAILSRGYGRKTTGVVLANQNSTPDQIGDEPFQYTQKFDIPVCVAEKRVEGAKKLINEVGVDTIILDDAYQHRAIYRDLNILITDYTNMFVDDVVMPLGRLREFRYGARRAHIIVISKCPKDLPQNEMIKIKQRFIPLGGTELFFSTIEYDRLPNDISELVLITGIANPVPLEEHLVKKNIKVIKHIKYKDHYQFTQKDVDSWHKNYSNCTLLTTEKDFTKIIQLDTYDLNIVCLPIKVRFLNEGFDESVMEILERNN